jgi:hypothetical protein
MRKPGNRKTTALKRKWFTHWQISPPRIYFSSRLNRHSPPTSLHKLPQSQSSCKKLQNTLESNFRLYPSLPDCRERCIKRKAGMSKRQSLTLSVGGRPESLLRPTPPRWPEWPDRRDWKTHPPPSPLSAQDRRTHQCSHHHPCKSLLISV